MGPTGSGSRTWSRKSQRDDVMIYAIGLSTPCDVVGRRARDPGRFGGRFSASWPSGRGPGGGGRGGPQGPAPEAGRGCRVAAGSRAGPACRCRCRPTWLWPGPRRRRAEGTRRSSRFRPPPPCTADRPDQGLRVVADESGGNYFELRGTDNLGQTFSRVADELHRQYLLAFLADEPRRQRAPARRPREHAGCRRAREEVLHCLRRQVSRRRVPLRRRARRKKSDNEAAMSMRLKATMWARDRGDVRGADRGARGRRRG